MKAKFEKRQAADGGEVEFITSVSPSTTGLWKTTPPPRGKVEPKSTAEAMCKAAGVPTAMVDKMLVVSIS